MDALGFWKDDGLWWRIDGEEISDKDLRRWCYHNMKTVGRYVTACVCREHTEAYAKRDKSK